ncbi:MAG: hypothetical protein IMZ61_01260 [Planctomycetes bacterium]|nr:hypothetical protein [Planctomycetota bacterium]
MNDSEVIENTISAQGMRWLHVIRMGEPVDQEMWLARVPDYSLSLVQMQRQYETGLDLHHLRLWWPAREPVRLFNAPGLVDGTTVLLWSLDKGQSLREAAIYAGVAYLSYFNRWPNLARFAKLPPEGRGVETIDIYQSEEEHVTARLVETGWVPKQFLVMEENND